MYQRIGKAAYKANLDNTIALDKHFESPHKNYKTIHVAGTNGKGSVSHMLTSVLMAAGYRVGLYTSPHLKDFRERIRVNGEMITENYVIDFVEIHSKLFDKIKPSFFEMTVAMAFDYFAKQKVDVAVIEVGLGGRLDSTNIITPELSIITNIGLDHIDLLGDTLQKIAIEKAGVIKGNIPVVINQRQEEVKDIFLQRSKELNAPITFADSTYKILTKMIVDTSQVFTVEGANGVIYNNLNLDLLGGYQGVNLVGVLASIDILNQRGFNICIANMYDGLSNVTTKTGLLGRWQVLGHSPQVVCDTGHNVDGINLVVEQIANTPHEKLHMVIGMVGDKNIDGMLSLLPSGATYYFTRASIPRAIDEKALAAQAAKYGLNGKSYPTVNEAISQAKQNANINDLIFIGGSTFVVADALVKNY
jgi:dihydrofolate synthase/folylpolyglutamate synthase